MPSRFECDVDVAYSQAYVIGSGDWISDLEGSFAGQTNGLCGAAQTGGLFLITGTHTGTVHFTVEVLDGPPPMASEWEDVVEASIEPETTEVFLQGWGGQSNDPITLDQVTTHRVRFSGSGRDAAQLTEYEPDNDPRPDVYLLQFWPASPGPDAILRSTSKSAAYWHQSAQSQPPPPPPPSPQELARLQAEQEAAYERQQILALWGDPPPPERIRNTGGATLHLHRAQPDVLEAFAALNESDQRELARWCAHRAFEVAGLADIDWGRAGLEAMNSGAPLPPPFDSMESAFAAVRGLDGPTEESETVLVLESWQFSSFEDLQAHHPTLPIHRPSYAVPSLFGAVQTDPLLALIEAFTHAYATFHRQQPAFAAEVRARIGA